MRYIIITRGFFTLQIRGQSGDLPVIDNGDLLKSAHNITAEATSNGVQYGVPILLTEDGARKFRDACLEYSATGDLTNTLFIMKIDEQSIYEAPITSQLADRLKSGPITLMIASMGTGDENRTRAMRIRSILKSGPLPAGLAIVQA